MYLTRFITLKLFVDLVLRIGAATNAAEIGKSDDEIMIMGRWKSDTYKTYIRIDTSL